MDSKSYSLKDLFLPAVLFSLMMLYAWAKRVDASEMKDQNKAMSSSEIITDDNGKMMIN